MNTLKPDYVINETNVYLTNANQTSQLDGLYINESKLTELSEEFTKLSKSARHRVNSQAAKHNVPKEVYMYYRANYKESATEEWRAGLNKSQAARVRKQAKRLNITPEEYISRRNNESNRQVASKKSLAKLELKQIAESINNSDDRNLTYDTTNVKVIPWESAEMQEILEDDPDIGKAKGIVLGLLHGKQPLRHKTFIHDNGNVMSDEEIKDNVMKLIPANDKMYDIEVKFAEKVGNLASLPFKDWVDKVVLLWRDVEFKPDEDLLHEAVHNVYCQMEDLLNGKLTPISVNDAYEKVTKGRNSGYPFFTSKWANNPEMVEYYKNEAENMLNGVKMSAPRILFKRTQNGGKTVKMRPVECPPKSEAIAAKCFTEVIIEAFKTSEQFCGFNGNTQIDSTVRKYLQYKYLLSSDFSEFDTRAKNFIPIVFEMMNTLSYRQYDEYFKNLTKYYLNCQLITPIGIMSGRNCQNGLQSGDGWTSVIGTLTNAICNEYYRLKTDKEIKVLSFGDDCVVVSDDKIDTDQYSEIMSELGMLCTPSKQELSTERLSFLGYYYFKEDLHKPDGKLHIFPMMRAVTKLIYQETPMSLDSLIEEAIIEGVSDEDLENLVNAKKVGIDLLSHLQKLENCKNHDKFEEFVMLFAIYEPNQMHPHLIKPFAPLKNYLKNQRVNRKDGIINSMTYKVLLNLHNLEE